MGSINFRSLLIGGLAAGLVINVGELILNGLLLADDLEALRTVLGLSPPSAVQLAAVSGITFVYGIALIWIYVSIRPRFGPGPMTAAIAGLTFWVIAYVLFATTLLANGMFTPRLTLISILWGVFEAPVAALIGASHEARLSPFCRGPANLSGYLETDHEGFCGRADLSRQPEAAAR